jgi:sugar transferase (PEP-CTERM/EpsH1 system associated)
MPQSLLYLVHRIPYPPNKGDKIRSYHLLKHLASRYEVHLGAFVDDENDWRYEDEVKRLCKSCCLVPMNPKNAKLKSLTGLLKNEALTLPYYRSGKLDDWVRRTMDEKRISRIVVFSSAMAQFVEDADATRIMDFVDVDSDKWSQYADAKSWPLNWLYRREGRLLLDFEKKIAESFDASFFVSPHEAELFRRLSPAAKNNIHHYSNGVDAEYFSPDRDYAYPYAKGEEVLVFTGAMDYWPNVDAVTWFAQDIFPKILKQRPNTRFFIVGSNPAKQVTQLGKIQGVTVTGRVDDVRPYLAHARLAVAPLRVARGVQNKVLEAMSMARHVIATGQAMEGIEATAGCYTANDADEFASLALQHLDSGKNPAGRDAILASYDWEKNLSAIDVFLENSSEGEKA